MKFNYLFVTILAFSILIASGVDANTYISNIYHSNQSAVNQVPTFSVTGVSASDITVRFNGKGVISSPANSVMSIYSPHDTLIVTAPTTNTGNVTFGVYDFNGFTNISNIESLYKLTSSGASYLLNAKTEFIVDSTSDNLIFEQGEELDNTGYVKNLLSNSSSGAGSPNIASWVTSNVYQINNITDYADFEYEPQGLNGHSWACDGGGSGANHVINFFRYFTFNSSHNGIMSYNVTKQNVILNIMAGGTSSAGYQIGYFEDGGLPTVLTTSATHTGTLSLSENTIYHFYIASYGSGAGTGAGTGSCGMSENGYLTDFNITIYTPNYNCSSWSICDSGSQFRECNDLNGVSSDTIQFQECYSLPDISVELGFEETRNVDVWKSYPEWWVVDCPNFANVFQVSYPNEWATNFAYNPTIIDNVTSDSGLLFDMVEMSSSERYSGMRALKLWRLPPQQYLPACTNQTAIIDLSNGTSCTVTGEGSYIFGHAPHLEQNINETYLVTRNITFDFPNMTISAYVKKCAEPVQQWAGNSSFLGFCGEGYYTNDKTSEWEVENTDVWLSLENIDTGVTSNWVFVANTEQWTKKEIRLENLSTVANYTLGVGIWSGIGVDNNVQCAYIDKLELNGYDSIVPCESRCAGNVRYEATFVAPNGCVFDIIEPSPICANEDNVYFIDVCSSWCDCDYTSSNYLTYYVGDNSTNECVWDKNSNSSYCSEYCAELYAQGYTKMTDALPFIDNVLDGSGNEWVGKFFSPLMIIFYILIIVMGIMSYFTGAWQIGIITGMIFMIALGTLYPIEFGWITIIFIILAGMILAKSVYPNN